MLLVALTISVSRLAISFVEFAISVSKVVISPWTVFNWDSVVAIWAFNFVALVLRVSICSWIPATTSSVNSVLFNWVLRSVIWLFKSVNWLNKVVVSVCSPDMRENL